MVQQDEHIAMRKICAALPADMTDNHLFPQSRLRTLLRCTTAHPYKAESAPRAHSEASATTLPDTRVVDAPTCLLGGISEAAVYAHTQVSDTKLLPCVLTSIWRGACAPLISSETLHISEHLCIVSGNQQHKPSQNIHLSPPLSLIVTASGAAGWRAV